MANAEIGKKYHHNPLERLSSDIVFGFRGVIDSWCNFPKEVRELPTTLKEVILDPNQPNSLLYHTLRTASVAAVTFAALTVSPLILIRNYLHNKPGGGTI